MHQESTRKSSASTEMFWSAKLQSQQCRHSAASSTVARRHPRASNGSSRWPVGWCIRLGMAGRLLISHPSGTSLQPRVHREQRFFGLDLLSVSSSAARLPEVRMAARGGEPPAAASDPPSSTPSVCLSCLSNCSCRACLTGTSLQAAAALAATCPRQPLEPRSRSPPASNVTDGRVCINAPASTDLLASICVTSAYKACDGELGAGSRAACLEEHEASHPPAGSVHRSRKTIVASYDQHGECIMSRRPQGSPRRSQVCPPKPSALEIVL